MHSDTIYMLALQDMFAPESQYTLVLVAQRTVENSRVGHKKPVVRQAKAKTWNMLI